MKLMPPQPQYRQIADLLADKIRSGVYERGSLLPSEWTLVDEYGVSRGTINKAIALLRADGLVQVERGTGVRISALPRLHRTAQDRYRRATREQGQGAYDVELKKLGLKGDTELTIENIDAPAYIAEALEISAGSPLLVRRRCLSADGTPTQIADTYIPREIAKASQIGAKDTGAGGMYSRLADSGYRIARFTEDIESRSATAEEAERLRLDGRPAMFVITNRTWTSDDRVSSVTYHVLPGHLWMLHYSWEADE